MLTFLKASGVFLHVKNKNFAVLMEHCISFFFVNRDNRRVN